MKKQNNNSTKAHLIRGAFYLLLLIAVCAIPFALAQRNATKGTMAQQQRPAAVPRSQGEMPNDAVLFSASARVSQLPLRNSGVAGYHPLRVLAPPKAPQVVLYDQYDNAGLNATSSQDFEASLDPFDDELADDFVVPGGQTWNVDTVEADGVYFNGPGPAASFNVRFYSDSGGLPGALVDSRIGMSYVQSGTTFSVTVSPAVALAAGTYWVSVQSRQDFTPFGQWGWTDRTVQSNSAAAWQNPGGGFATACTTWGQRGATCGIDPGVPDQVYRLLGTTGGGGTPTPTPTGSPTCTPIEVTGSIDLGDPTQFDRLFRSGIAQTCPASTTCSIFGDLSPHHYDSYSFTNTAGATQCVHIDTNTACTGTNFIFTAAYLGSFDPNNVCTNWIGDSGSSPNPEIAFDVDVPAGQTLVVVVSEVTSNAGCASYTVTIDGLCGQGTPTPTPTATPTPTPGGIVLRANTQRINEETLLVHLRWKGTTTPSVNIYRNGVRIARVPNQPKSYADTLTVPGTYTYQVCEFGTGNCSNEVTVTFTGSGQ